MCNGVEHGHDISEGDRVFLFVLACCTLRLPLPPTRTHHRVVRRHFIIVFLFVVPSCTRMMMMTSPPPPGRQGQSSTHYYHYYFYTRLFGSLPMLHSTQATLVVCGADEFDVFIHDVGPVGYFCHSDDCHGHCFYHHNHHHPALDSS